MNKRARSRTAPKRIEGLDGDKVVRALQRVVGANETGIIDDPTKEALKTYSYQAQKITDHWLMAQVKKSEKPKDN